MSQKIKIQPPAKPWDQVQIIEEYIDFEPAKNLHEHGLARISFVRNENYAYGCLANPAATPENDEDISIDDQIRLTWEEAEVLIGHTVAR